MGGASLGNLGGFGIPAQSWRLPRLLRCVSERAARTLGRLAQSSWQRRDSGFEPRLRVAGALNPKP